MEDYGVVIRGGDGLGKIDLPESDGHDSDSSLDLHTPLP